ncbi:MAG: haloacid dehalogenase-like hydrolase [Clostridiales bacterium]|nr:haloacid dehalogenase-like hydrolase [Clostridiales bacterium]
MQEYGFLPGLNIEPDRFWAECREFAVRHRMDAVLAYMYKMYEKARLADRALTRAALMALGEQVAFFPGVVDWFPRVNRYGALLGLRVEHYIISSGLQEIIEGSAIAAHFKAVFAAAFLYGPDGRAIWPASAVNYTSKTQYLFRINKGILDVTNDRDLNDYTPEELRRIPFPNMIYVGDGLTDVPSMKMTRSKGGVSIAVHPPGDTRLVDAMLVQQRVDYALPADYSAGGEMERTVFMLLRRIRAMGDGAALHNRQMEGALRRLDGEHKSFAER